MRTFKKGDRVQFSPEWLGSGVGHNQRYGTIIGHARNPDCVRVRFDGTKTPQAFHVAFLEKTVESVETTT